MTPTKKKVRDRGRREFLTGAGAALAVGAFSGFTNCSQSAQLKLDRTAARLAHDPSLCAGCGVCGLMCSLYNEKETSRFLSRSEIVRDPFEAGYSLSACRQCPSPSCYQACPLKDSALCIDETTGVKYINAGSCDGCGECIQACPMEPARVKLKPETKIAFKCDLCMNREDGPVCIEYCSQQALTLVPVNVRV
jgi:Fe-S-cluster-containing hydrogenase component 2